MSATHFLRREEYESFLARFDCFLFDCDGVIWEGSTLIKGASEAIAYLRQLGKKILFVTNNATKSRQTFKHKFDDLGMEANVEEVFGSAYATATYLKNILKFPPDRYAYILGEAGIEAEFDAVGIRHKGGTNSEDNAPIQDMDFSSIVSDSSIGAVVCGLDTHINYKKLARAFRYLRENQDCHFVLTNEDSTFPTGKGELHPGAGSISAPLRYMLPDRKPLVIGKPNQPMLDSILTSQKLDPKKTLMVGDRLDTDIAFGKNGGIATLMVLTGVNSRADFEDPGAVVKPDFCIDSLGDFAVLAQSGQ